MDSTLQNASSISEQKYIQLRKRLDQLGYRQTLGIDSLPLIEKLFNDLVHTTESLKKLKLESNKNVNGDSSVLSRNGNSTNGDLNLSTTNIQAYKSDNAKLIKENNELHLELIKLKDENEATAKDLKASIRKLEHENSDLRFLNTQYIHKLRAIEKESKDKSKKILELQEKNFQAVIQTPSGTKQTIPFRRQRLDIDCMLPGPSPRSDDHKYPNGNDPYLIDMIKLADERILQLQCELEKSNQSAEILDTKLSNYKNQVENRDKEIERLSRLLDGGRSYDVVSLEAKLRNNDKIIQHQNLQIEYLQDKNHQLEKRLDEYADVQRETFNGKCKNDELMKDLKEINRLAKKAEIDKKTTVEAADRELFEAKYEIQRSREEINSLDSALQQMNMDKRNLFGNIEELKEHLNEKNSEISNLHELIQKLQDDKVKLSKRISKLLDNEKELVKELDSKGAKRSNSTTRKASGASASSKNGNFSLTAKVDAHIKNIEHERDYLKKEVDTLNKLLQTINTNVNIPTRLSPSPSVSPTRRSRNGEHDTKSPARLRSVSSHSPNPVRCTICQSSSVGNNRLSPSPQKQQRSILKSPAHNDELILVLRERDELKALLDKFERHMAEIQTNVKVLTNERDKLNHLYEETRDELQRTRRELLKSPKTPNVSLAAQTILKRVENERDTALFDLRNAANERDSLAERLRLATESTIQERASLEQQIEDLQVHLKKNDYEKGDLYRQIEMLKNEINDMEARLRQQNYQLTQTAQELNDQKSTSTQIRMIAEESDRSLEELRRQLSMKNEELNMSQQISLRLEQKLNDFQELNRSLKDELSSMRSTVGHLDKEKDKLLQNVDEKTEQNVTLKQELSSKHHRIDELNNQLAELDAALDKSNDELKNKNKEVISLRIQVDRTNEELASVARKLDGVFRENKRLQDDLVTITRENQVIHSELDKTNRDKEVLREQLQEYINEVSKCDDLISQKESERGNLLDQYREATNELSKMKMTLNTFETEVSNLKVELQMKQAENKRLRERVDTVERDNQQQISICQEYEMKLSNMSRSLQRHEEAIKKYQIDNNELMQDVMHLRELNSRLETNKEELTRHLTSKEIDNEQLQNLLGDSKAEIDLLRSQINSERIMVNNLEDLIASNREKEFHVQLTSQERDSEIQLLRDRISLNEQKIQTQNKEISALRTKIVEFESDNERLKRQLTNERFERERAAQELRKISDNVDLNSSRMVRSLSPAKQISFSASLVNTEFISRSRSHTPDHTQYSDNLTANRTT